MLVNNGTRIGRLPLGAGPVDNYHHHHHHHLTAKTTLSSSSSILSTSTSKATTKDLFSPTLKKRHHRSCQSSCHSSSSTSSSSSSQISNYDHGLELGQKVAVSSMNALGTIRFIGTTSFKSGTWVGIELDIIGTGKNSGTINGVRYFNCPPETGLFILAKRVTPLKQPVSSTPINAKTALAMSPKKCFTTTTTTRSRRTKTPSIDSAALSTKTTQNNSSRQRCLSHEHHQQHKPTTVPSASPKRKSPIASLSTKTPRLQSRVDISATTTIGHKASSANFSSLTCNKTPLSTTTRKLVTPVMSLPSKPPNIKQHHSKSTRQTVTPTTNTLKKRNSSLASSTTTKHTLQGTETPRKSKSTSTRQVVTQDELKKMHTLLEQSRQEKQRLSDEMNGKEAVWERLVTAKESYALKVQDMQKDIARLQDSLQRSQEHAAQLEAQLTQNSSPPLSSSSGCTPNSLHGGDPSSSATSGNGGNGIYGISTTEQQYLQRIEKLERLVREWQHDAQDSHQQMQQQQRTYTAQIEQLRRDITERDQATAAMEREYEAAKQENSDTIRQYEATLVQWTAERDKVLASKDNHISRLDQVIDELKACHLLLPPSPNNEEEEADDEDGSFDTGYNGDTIGITDLKDGTNTDTVERAVFLTSINSSNNNSNRRRTGYSNSIHSSRRRLEQQLELTTIALEDVQQKHKTATLENEQLREQLSHMHAASGLVDQQFQQLQRDLSDEISDKRKVMEERDVALQCQLRMEDNYKDLVMTNTRLEQQLEQQQDTQEKLLKVENRLTELQQQHSLLLQQTHDAAITGKKQQQQQGQDYSKGNIRDKEDQIQDGMENDLAQQHQIIHDENTSASYLQRVIADMTLEMEKKALRIAQLEKDLYHVEQFNTHHPYVLDPQQQQQRQRFHNHNTTAVALTSPMCSGIIMPISPISDTPSPVIIHTSSPPSRANSLSGHNSNLTSFGDMSLMAAMNKEKSYGQSSETYCVNCDLFGTHTTRDCPTQDETY